MKLLQEECPEAIKEYEIENYTGRKIAIDASMAMYQFLVAVRSAGAGGNGASAQLMNDAGEVTSHIQGMFNRTIKMMTSGVRPVYIFDGKPPDLKGGELAKRLAKRAKAENDLAAAKAAEDVDEINKFSSRLVKVTRQHNEDCKELLRLMGVPVINAPCEAEAQCAELARNNKVFATATEDMDALTFRTPKLVRKMTFSQAKGKDKQPIVEIDFAVMLKGLDLTYEEFVDLCIMCGCDYCSSIKGVGPKTALKLIRQHKTIENILSHLVSEKYDVPDEWFEQKVPLNHSPNEDEEEEEKAENDANDGCESDPLSMPEDETKESADIGKENIESKEADIKEETVEEETPAAAAAAAAVSKPDIATAAAPVVGGEAADVTTASNGEDVTVVATGEQEEETKTTTTKKTKETKETKQEELKEGEYEVIPPLYQQARKLFLQCEVTPAEEVELKWESPDEPALLAFLVDRMGFNADRVAGAIKRLKEAQNQKPQKRMDSFFSVVASSSSTTSTGAKRKAEEAAAKANKGKRGKAGGMAGGRRK